MATLHQVTENTKKILVFAGIGIGGLICLVLIIQIFFNLKDYFFPAAPTAPTTAFGKLPTITFPDSPMDASKLSYTITTVSGSLPLFPDKIAIYKITPPQPSLLQFQKTQNLVTKIGFTNTPTAVSDGQFVWKQGPTDSSFVTKKLSFNTATLDFSLTSNYLTTASLAAVPTLPDQPGAIQLATTFFTSLNSFPADIDGSKTTTQIYTIQNGQLIPATSLSKAEFIKVNFFQNDIDKLPIVYLHTPGSSLNTLVAAGPTAPDVVEANYFHQAIDMSQSATYPLKTAQQAFADLKAGKTYIAHYDSASSNVIIRNISLGYFLGEMNQSFVWPVIIFQGDNNFYAYVNAVTDAWIEK